MSGRPGVKDRRPKLFTIPAIYTIFVIMPTNRRLMNTPARGATAETRSMIGWWGILHAGRSALGHVATLIFLWD
jgi:hypothetical protein